MSQKQIDAQRDAIEAFLAELHVQFDSVYADPTAFAAQALPYLSGATEETLVSIYTAMADAGLFPKEDALSEAQVADTLAFYEDAGQLDKGKLTPADVADFSFSGN